jgi:hypothetical protein
MKSLALVIAVLALFAGMPAYAQTATDELETARTQIQADRKAIVSRLMVMTETESAAFWPVYNEYREEIRKVDDQLVDLSESYFKGADSLTDKQAQEMLSKWIKLRGDRLAVKKSYVKKFSKAIPTTKLIRYYQIENKMDAVVEYELAAAIPLVQ